MDHEYLKTITIMRRELIKHHAYGKWKKYITEIYGINYKTSLEDLTKLVLEKSCEYYRPVISCRGGWLLSQLFSPGTSFQWCDTEEGFDYWNWIFHQIDDVLLHELRDRCESKKHTSDMAIVGN